MSQAIRWGIIGTGDVAERKGGPALYLADRSQLVAVTNRTISRAESFATRHGDPRVHASVDQLLEDEGVDAVYVATPPSSHAELTMRVAEAGKHVFCEKPMAATVSDCEQMILACEQQGVSLAIAYYRRYFPVVQQMRRLLEAGAVGKPLRVSATTIAPFAAPQGDAWRLDATISGGGFLMDMGTHRFDLMAYLFGPALQIRSLHGTQSLATEVDDVATLAIEFAEQVHGSAEFHWNCPVNRDSFAIVGTQGILSTDSLSNAGRLTLETSNGRELWQLPAAAPVHLNLVQAFVDHLLDGKPNPLPGNSAIHATQIAEAAYAAHP